MSVLRDAGGAAKGDQRGRRGGFKGQFRLQPEILVIKFKQENYSGTYLFLFPFLQPLNPTVLTL